MNDFENALIHHWPCSLDKILELYHAEQPTTCFDVLQMVSEKTGIPMEILQGRSRKREYVYPRKVYCHMAYELTDTTYEEVGRLIGIDYSSTLYHVRTVDEAMGKPRNRLFQLYKYCRG